MCFVLGWCFTVSTSTREHLWRLWTSWDAKMKSRRWNNRPKGTLEEKERQARRRWLASPRGSGYLWKHRWSCIILRNDAVVPCVSGQGSGWHCMTIYGRQSTVCYIFRLINHTPVPNPTPPHHKPPPHFSALRIVCQQHPAPIVPVPRPFPQLVNS